MPTTFVQPSPSLGAQKQNNKKSTILQAVLTVDLVSGLLLAFMAVLLLVLSGCGAGGYAGGDIEALSASAVTLDAGQSYKFTTMVDGTPTVTYSLSGTTCTSGSACGSMSNTTGPTVVYTAPTGITAQMVVILKAAVSGTSSASSVTITVNPDPTLAGTPPAGTVGVAYSTTLTPSGGTAPLTLSISAGSLPPGLTFNATTGAITGTPTTAGTYSFTAQLTDSSAVPYLLTTQETIVIAAPGATSLTISGNPPTGVVGVAYSTLFAASGGSGPYTFSLLSGVLPAGLTLSPAGVLSGTPTATGVSVFTLQAQDSVGDKSTAVFSITITSSSLSLTLSTLPNGTVNVPYSSTIGVTGGTAPYSCVITNGTLPAGLKLTGCLVSGTPTVAGTANLTVMATDSSSPQETTTGPVSLTINPAGSLTLTSPPAGTVNTPYTGTIGVGGGTAPYTCTITAGTLPAGLSISNCTITGTPTTAGTTSITVKGTDSSNPALTTTGPVSIVINPSALSLTLSSLPNGTINVPYSSTIGVSGGTAPYACTITAGTLPAGLSLSGCLVSGTPTVAETVNLTVKATDASNPEETTTGPVSLTINPAALSLTLSSLPSGTVNVPYSSTIGVKGGTAPYACTITAGILPAGLSLSGCLVSGTPTVAGTANLTVKATDSSNPQETTTGPVTLTINPAGSLTLTSPPSGTANTPYTGTIGVSGGTAPYSCSITAGTLPAGLSISNCTITGTPTTPGTTTITVKGTDSSNPVLSTTGPITIVINPGALSLTLSSLPNGTVNVPYSSTIGVSGGTSPYACTITSGTLPAGLTLTGCLVSGTPTVAGTVNLMVKATDSSSPQETTTGPVSLTINPASLSLTLSTLPNGTVNVPYSSTIGVSGGTSPYSCVITNGTLPAGLSLTGCLVSGTPTVAGTVKLTVKATDSSNPQETTTGPVSLTINPAAAMLTLTSPPAGTVNTPYTGTIGVSGGTAPYTCAITAGTLPAGLSISNCTISGTPTTAGSTTITVKGTDSSSPADTTTGPVTIIINPSPLSLTLSSLPNGTVDVPYSSTIGVNGGTAPYSCTITNGTLPAGLSLTGCLVSGTPTTAGTATLEVKATDSSNPQETTTGPVSLTINPAGSLTLTSPPAGTVSTPYTGTIGVSGGTAPYTCSITAGTLPAGLSISNCTITGTPTTAGTTTLTVKGTDSSTPTALTTTGPVTLVINPPAATLTITSPPPATVDTPYTGPIGVTGGTAPYSCTITSGTLPAGLTLTSAGCVITGTPTTAGSSTVTVSATGSGTNPVTGSGPVTITVQALTPLSFTGALPNAIQNVAYTQTLTAQGGVAPYTYTLTAGTLPAGINLSTSTSNPQGAVFSGTPTVVGLSAFTVTVTDSEPTPQSVALPLTLLVQYPTGPNDSYLTGPYAYLFQGYDNAVIGALAYKTATVGSFTANGTGGISAGEMDANHQSSTATTGNTVSSNTFVGTYTIGADDRGTMMIIPINANGTIGKANTYDIAVKAPVSPATNSAQGNMVEYDPGTVTAGTEGSGTFLAQTASALSAGLNGSYAFGVSGDQACSVSCSVNLLLGGSVGTVGEFTANGESADGGSITGGVSDTNIVTTNTTESQLSGTYSTVDQNGRVALVMNADNITNTLYPTDFAVYVVNSNQAFVMSTDAHSAFILLAGSAQLQSPAFLSGSTAIKGSFVGYENSAPDPGLVSVTLQQLTNLTTATIFEGSSTSSGCDIASVTIGGLTSIENSLGSVVGLSTLLGNYENTGDVDCAVDSTGRGILDYPTPTGLLSPVLALLGLNNPPPPRVFYLSSLNTGYFLETGYAAVGTLVNQTGAPYTGANTFTGNYVIASTPPGSAVSINGTGVVDSNGVPAGSTTGIGTASVTQDSVVQVGDLNLLTLGTATTESYGPINSTTGVFSLGTNLAAPTYTVYTISPDSYVLVDPSLTSPSVSVLY